MNKAKKAIIVLTSTFAGAVGFYLAEPLPEYGLKNSSQKTADIASVNKAINAGVGGGVGLVLSLLAFKRKDDDEAKLTSSEAPSDPQL